MIPFVIVADFRTGSTLLQASLDRHPQIRCIGELLHGDDLPDNQLPGCDRRSLNGTDLVDRAFDAPNVSAAGFRLMVSQPFAEQPQWFDVWDALATTDALRVIFLSRRDRLAQFASIQVAQQTGKWHPSPGDPVLKRENRPSITIDSQQFELWCDVQSRLYESRRQTLGRKPQLDIDYESLTSDWTEKIDSIQEFLGVEALPLPQEKQIQETRELSQVITNLHELRRSESHIERRT